MGAEAQSATTRFLQKLARWTAREQPFWRICTGVFFVFAALKGLHPVRDWPLTQAQLDYSHGFIERGLQGQVLKILHLNHHHGLSIVFFLQLIALFLLLALLIRSARVEERFGTLIPVAIFASSYAVTYLTYDVGYTDIPLAACMVGPVLLPNATTRFWCAVLLVPIALLVHESFLLMFLPALLFSFYLEHLMTGGPRKRNLEFAVTLAILSVAITLFASLRPRLSEEQAEQFDAEVTAHADFNVRDDFFDVLSRPLSGSLQEGKSGIALLEWRRLDLITLADLLPIAAVLLYFSRRLLRSTVADSALRGKIWIGVFSVVLTPLLMYLLGVDGARWNTTSTLASFVALLLLCRDLPPEPVMLTAAERNLAVLLVAFNMATGMGFFDGQNVNNFPFFPHQ